jgi:mannose-1-phosphate guanylyltransferase/phosphomannomutase
MKAVVMAGGEGTRLRPLTVNRPKPLVPICNKPVMEYIIELLKRHGVDQVVVTLHYLANEVVSYFGDGSDWGIQMIYSVEDEPLGTAGSIKKVEQYLTETFIIISGDALTDFDLGKAVASHRENEALATIVLTRVENPLEYGVVITDEKQRIQRFLEKPSWGEVFSDTVNTGIYVLEPDIFDHMEADVAYDFSKDLFPAILAKDLPLYGHIATGYWSDIGNLQSYRQAHYDLFDGRCQALMAGKRVSEGIWIGEGTEIHPSVVIRGPAVIGRNCRIKESAEVEEMSVIGDNCLLEEGAEVHRSIVWNNVFLGRKSRLTGTTVCRGVTVKGGSSLQEGVIIGDKCFIGSGATIHPGVKVWPDKNIEAGATVSMSLIWGIQWPGSLFGQDGISGIANIEITPEFALKLGAAYGASLEKGTTVTTSRDAHPASRMFNRAIICGLISVGCNVYDLRVCPTPVARYTIRNSGLKGGIHSRISPEDARSVLIEFFDTRGININKTSERKIENLFFREDFRRTSLDEVGVIEFPSRAIGEYNEGFFNNISADIVRRANFKVVIDYAYGNASLVLPLLLGKLGAESVAINAYLDAQKGRLAHQERAKGLQQLSNIVTTLEAHLGVVMDLDAECLVIIDEKGRIIDGQQLLALMVLLTLRRTNNAIIAVPITAPAVLEKMAASHHGKIIRTKTDGRSLMHTAQLGEKKIHFAGRENGAFIFPHFQPSFDGMFAFARLLELMAQEKLPLSQLLDEVPEFHQAARLVDCPRQHKGRVMRGLIEDSRNRPMDLIEGIKVYFDDAWVLAVPDPTLPHLRLVAEAGSEIKAEKMLDSYAAKIEKIVSSEELPPTARTPRVRRRRDASRNGEPAVDGQVLPDEKAFHFWSPGRYLGVRATSFKEFVDTVLYIDLASLEYHMDRGDFVNWFEYELQNESLARNIQSLRDQNLRGEELRNELLKLVR